MPILKPDKEYTGRATIRMFNCDNRLFMEQVDDNHYDLAICDPEYGIKKDGQKKSICKNSKHNRKEHKQKDWDSGVVSRGQINEVIRVCKNQILWGANYYPEYLTGSMGWIFWDKGQRINQSDGELAYTSFQRALRVIEANRVELLKQGAIHPTEKPIYVYKHILSNYAEPGQRIFDGWGGSMSIAIACWDLGFDLDICELDKDYFDAAVKRFENHIAQQTLF